MNDPLEKKVEVFLDSAQLVPPFLFFIGGITVLVTDMDPMQFLLNLLVPEQTRTALFPLFLVIRCAHLSTLLYFVYVILVASLMFTVFELYITFRSLFHLKHWILFYRKFPNYLYAEKSGNLHLKKLPNIINLINIHAQLNLLETTANIVFFYETPSLLLLGSTVLIFSNYATISLHSTIPMPYFLIMPFVSGVILCGISVLFPPASEVHENSECFLTQAKILVYSRKYLLRVLMAQRSFRFNLGCLFMVKKSTYTTFLRFVIDNTINAILL